MASVLFLEATAAALRASPMRKQVRRTVRLVRPRIGERSRTGLGNGGRVKDEASAFLMVGTIVDIPVGEVAETGSWEGLAGV